MRKSLAITAAAAALLLGACGDDDDVAGTDRDADREISVTPDDQVDELGKGDVVVEEDEGVDFSSLDSDGDAMLGPDEVDDWVLDEGLFDDWDLDGDGQLTDDEVSETAFGMWDDDGDGALDTTEWGAHASNWFPEDLDYGAYGDWDADADGGVDPDEFRERFDVADLGETWADGPMDEVGYADGYFELNDADRDGALSESEWAEGSEEFSAAG